MSLDDSTLTTPLYSAHVEAGARIDLFAGYAMPIQYASVIAEAKAVRERAGMFDVSHMARLRFLGKRVLQYLEWITANDISRLGDGEGQYSLLPNEEGGCVDDVIVYRINDFECAMVVNASNHEKDVAWMRSKNDFGVEILDQTAQTAMIAIQGPAAVELLAEISTDPDAIRNAPSFGIVECELGGIRVWMARSGYTGEDGYEVICGARDATALWNVLLANDVVPCGLASRNILRVEAGLPLYGRELLDTINPISAGLGWVVSKTKNFIGSDPINRARAEGTPTKLQGIRLDSKRVAPRWSQVFVDGEMVGEVSSGAYSPTFECGIAFAFVNSNIKLGTACAVRIREKMEPGTIVSKRFFKRDR